MSNQPQQHDGFWQELRGRLDAEFDSVSSDPITEEEAERRLENAQEAPLGDGQYHSIVHDVIAAAGPPRNAEVIPIRSWTRSRRAAAILSGSLLLLTAAFVTQQFFWPERRHSRETLTYIDAVNLAFNADQDLQARESAVTRLTMLAHDGANAIKDSMEAGGPLERNGRRCLDRFRSTLEGAESPLRARGDIDPWFARLADLTLPTRERVESQDQISQAVVESLVAIQKAAATGPASLSAQAREALRAFRGEL